MKDHWRAASDPVFRGVFVAHLEVLDWSDLPAGKLDDC
jgi:hypothetical protein